MITVGVTGASGFFGWHLRSRLRSQASFAVRTATRSTFESPDSLDGFLEGCDVVVHLAGVNRAEPHEVVEGNVGLARALAESKTRTSSRFVLAYANSTKAGEDSAYGQSKMEAAELLAETQQQAGDRFIDVSFPHLFGEHGRPFYNSAVTTFAHLIATGGKPEIKVDSELELVHVQDAAQVIMDAVADPDATAARPTGTPIMVSDALQQLQSLAAPYLGGGLIPDLPTRFDTRMFNMLRSQLFPDRCPISLVKHADERGVFFETIRSQGKGQSAISTTAPGVTRGDHFHFDKVERFVVVKGEAIIRIRRLLFDQVHEYRVSGDDPVAIDMPTLQPHNITNVGSDELVTQFWANDLFDPENPDTVPETV